MPAALPPKAMLASEPVKAVLAPEACKSSSVPVLVPAVVKPVEAVVADSSLPVVKVEPEVGPVIDSPVPVCRAVALIAIAVPLLVEAAVRLNAPLALFVGEVIITLPVLAADEPA